MIEESIHIFANILDWLRQHNLALVVLGIISIFTFIGTLILMPILVVRLPIDYFAHPGRRRKPWMSVNAIFRILLLIGKNILGIVFVCAGIVMLVLPGQGILTILIGLTLIDFPGKFTFERWLVTRPAVLKSVNWLRQKAGRERFVFSLFEQKNEL